MFSVCPKCGEYAVEKRIDSSGPFAKCPHCQYAHPFLQQPLFIISGASGTGKTTVCLSLISMLKEYFLMVSPQVAPTRAQWRPPVGTIYVYDPSPLNWLFITWNTMEEPIRVDQDGRVVNALATGARWPDERTLELDLREGVRFQDGEPFTAHNVKQNFDEMQRWTAPHPPGSWLNFPPESSCEVVNEYTVRFNFPAPEGLALGKMRGFHIASSAFWREQGFGYAKLGSGEGHW